MTHAEKADALFRQGFNCAQSVFLAFEDLYGLDRESALKLSSPFGAGFGMMREVCGAVSGACMALGLLEGYADPGDAEGKRALYAAVQALAGTLEQSRGTLICRELLGLQKGEELAEPAVRDESYYASRPCAGLCAQAAQLLDDYLAKK
jgi:C_GCAxxG_C_C family probable redox protein